MLDQSIPTPVPGVKPGFAHIITLVVWSMYGAHAALKLNILRILSMGVLLGQFFSLSFFLAIAGLLLSTFCLMLLDLFKIRQLFGLIGVSILTAYAHVLGQWIMARFLLDWHDGLLIWLPFFLGVGLIGSIVNAFFADRFLTHMAQFFLQNRASINFLKK
jgi:heptaprenyl diphosphate synthase